MAPIIRGVTKDQEINPEFQVRDIRPIPQRTADWLRIPQNTIVTLLSSAGLAYMYPAIADYLLALALLLFAWAMTRREATPLKMPIQAKMPDANEPHPATGKPTEGQGIFFLGNDIKSGKEVWLTNSDCRQHVLVLGTTGAGKALPEEARVHTPAGWRLIGDLVPGDKVSTPDGDTATVTGVFPQGELEIWRMRLADGRVVDSSPDHLWEICRRGGKEGDATSVLTTRSIHALLAAGGAPCLPLPKPVEKPEADLPLPPYVLGALLGGSDLGQAPVFHAAGDDLVAAVDRRLQEIGYCLAQDGDGHRVAPVGGGNHAAVGEVLRRLALAGATGAERFVPACYKEASVEQRWELVRGLMDAAGGANVLGAMSFAAAGEAMARDVQELVWSLGGLARLAPRRKADRATCQVTIRHAEPTSFFSLAGKQALVDRPYHGAETLKLRILSVEPTVRRAKAVCIAVDHPRQLFVTDGYVPTHNTEALLGFAANALSWASGFLFCDGKGDVALFAKVYAMARRFGREDDILVLNFMNGNEDVAVLGGKLRSNTMNPFATGSSDGLTQMVVSLMDDVGGDGAMWKGRATAMLTGVMRALCWLRDQGILDLNVGEIRDAMNLKRIIELADEKEYPDLPQPIRKSIRAYLASLPGYQEDKREKQAQTTLDQHGYLEMQFTKILGSLADVYGHIFDTPFGEVDMHDVVLNRRILVIMLPALEKSGDEIANLGKIVVATLKGMMGGTLGSRLEGNWADVVENRPTNSPSPFICILDEVGYYTVEGMALMAAQARSLGFCMVYASQDIPAMKRLNEKEAASIIANTNTKIFMRTEEVSETGKLAVDTGDKAVRVRNAGFERDVGDLGTFYREGGGANLEETNRVNFTDLKAQGSGDMHVMFQEKLVRAKTFYAQPEASVDLGKLRLRPNHFVTVKKPSLQELDSARRAPELMARMADPEFPATLLAEAKPKIDRMEESALDGDEIALVARSFEKVIQAGRKPIEAACASVADVMRVLRSATTSFQEDVRTSYRQGAPMVPPGGFGPGDDLEIVTHDGMGGEGLPPTGGFGYQGDYDEPPPGVPFGTSPPPYAPPRRPFAAPRKPPRVDPTVPHGAAVDTGSIINMADSIGANDAVMRSLATLDFDGDKVSQEEVETAIEESLGGFTSVANEAPADRGRAVSAVEAFDRAASAVQPQDRDDEDGGEEGGELVSAFLEQLLADE